MEIIRINAMWCPGCIKMKKIWLEIENKYQDVIFKDYDYDLDNEIIDLYHPGDILPIAIFIKNDQEITRLTGEVSSDEITKIIELMSR